MGSGIPYLDSKYKVAQHIQALGVSYTIIGPAAFLENAFTYFEVPIAQGRAMNEDSANKSALS